MGILVLCFYKKVMQEILRWEKQVPLTYKLMVKAAPSWAQCRLYDDLKRFKTLDQACAGKPCLIVLYTLKPTGKRQRGGHYSLVIRHGQAARYWSSYGFPVEYEIALSHQASHLKRLLGGGGVNDEVPYQAIGHTETCWRWCLLRANLFTLPESRFKKLFYRMDAAVKSPDDLCSLITLGMLGPEYMVEALRSHGRRS